MKTKIFLLVILLFSEKLIAQSTVIEPNVFRLSTVTTDNCPVGYKGKIYFNTNLNKMMYCSATNTANSGEDYWQGNSDIYYLGKIGLGNLPPTYELEINNNYMRTNILIVDGKLGLNTTSPTEKLELRDKEILIRSTADIKNWTLGYIPGLRLEIRENGFSASMFASNGGNIGIGNPPYLEKFKVNGDVNYNGNLSVGGQGLVQNSSATQLKIYTGSVDVSANANPVAPNSCQVSGFSLGNNNFSAPPAVAVGQKITGNNGDEKLIMTVETVTASGGTVRFCNVTGSTLTYAGHSYSIVAIGQGN